MKKFITMAIVISLLCMLTACGSSREIDIDFAYVEITTSTGISRVESAFHGNDAEYEMQRQRQAIKSPVNLDLADGETATICFHCNQCGYNELIEDAVAPYAKVFACECSGSLAEGNMTEYIAVTIGINANLDDVANAN